MATDKKFAVAGASTFGGDTKIRFANDMMRIKILQKNGHTDIDLVELPTEMTKAEIVQHLKSIKFGLGNAAIEAAIAYAGSVPGQSLAVTCDVSKVQDIEQLFAPMLTTFGRVDLLFNNVCRSMAVPSISRWVRSTSVTWPAT